MTAGPLAFTILVVCLAGFAQGLTGFGFGLIAISLLPLFMGLKAAVALIALFTPIVCGMTFISLGAHYSWRRGLSLLVGALLGVPLGVWLLVRLDEVLLLRLLGGVMVWLSAQELIMTRARSISLPVSRDAKTDPSPLPSPLRKGRGGIVANVWRWGWSWDAKREFPRRIISSQFGFPFGLLSGGLSGAFGLGGPPAVAFSYGQSWGKEQIVAVLQVVFGASALLRLLCMGGGGLLDKPLLVLGLFCLVPMMLATLLGQRLFLRIPLPVLKEATFVLLALMGLKYLFLPQTIG